VSEASAQDTGADDGDPQWVRHTVSTGVGTIVRVVPNDDRSARVIVHDPNGREGESGEDPTDGCPP
jgi:hypothetical protein